MELLPLQHRAILGILLITQEVVMKGFGEWDVSLANKNI